MTIDVREPIEVNTFGFNIPVREFVISAQVTRDKRMPLVDEFILRALNIVEKVSISKLARYFNFEGADIGVVLADLQGRSLVSVSGDNVSLHPSAQELFRTAANKEAPTIATVEEFHASVWFELIGQSLISRKGPHNVRNLLYLKPSGLDKDFGPDFAREAFDANFQHFLRRIQGVHNADQWSLYSILDVQPGRLSYAQLAGREQLILGAHPKVEPVLLPEDDDRAPSMRRLVAAMADELRHVGGASASASARDEYSRLVGSDAVKRAMRSDGFLDIVEWLGFEAYAESGPTQAIIGYPYIERNLRSLATVLPDTKRAASSQERGDIVWLRPGGTNWGVSEDLGKFLAELRALLRQHLGPGSVASTLLIPSSVPSRAGKTFERLFDRGVQLPPSSLPAGLELLLVPGIAAVVCTMVPLSAETSVPVGLVTADPERVRKIEERSKLGDVVKAGTQIWKHDSQSRGRRSTSSAEDARRA